jgi:4-amino-4-deoxy-L-arabinose transferase-like glycosyltransferase
MNITKYFIHKQQKYFFKAKHEFIFIAATAIFARGLITLFFWKSRFYYPDSEDYVIRYSQPGPPSSFHPPTIWHIWNIFTFGYTNEFHVLLFQNILGIATTIILFSLLRQKASKRISILLTVAYITTPWQYFFERSFLPETVAIFLILVIFLLYTKICALPSNQQVMGVYILIGFSFGILLILKTLYTLFSFIAFMLIIAVVWMKVCSGIFYKMIATIASVVAFLTPIALLSMSYERTYGILTPSPATGTFLAARWGGLIPCEVANSFQTKIVHDAILEICQQPKWAIPGEGNDLLWSKPNIGKTLAINPNFSAIQRELLSATLNSIKEHPLLFASEYTRGFLYPFVHQLTPNDLVQYLGGTDYIKSVEVEKYFPQKDSWFMASANQNRARVQESNFKKVVMYTQKLPYLFMILFIFVLGIKISRKKFLVYLFGTKKFLELAKKIVVRQSLLLFMLLYLALTQAMIAFSTVINFRYYLSFIPVWILLIGEISVIS